LNTAVLTGELLTHNPIGETNELYLDLRELLFIDSIANVDQDPPHVV